MSLEICPSILNAENVEEFLDKLVKVSNDSIENAVAYVHLDVMDEKFVKNKGVSLEKAQTITSFGFLNDVHLMVEDVKEYVEKTLKYTPAVITIHYEAPKFEENIKYLNEIRDSKKVPYFDIGVSIKPNTDVEVLEKYVDLFDVLLIMSVEPGLGGQKFMPETYQKIQKAKILFGDKILQLDGGINEDNIEDIQKSGVDRVVIGSYLTSAKNIAELEDKFNKLRRE